MTHSEHSQSWKVLVAFALVYVMWGSTYLGIGIAVEHIAPAMLCGVRFLIAGVVLLGYCAATGRSIRFSQAELAQQAGIGVLLLVGGNLTLSWAEQYVPTGLAALIVASIPLWFLLLDSWLLGHHSVSGRGQIGLALGAAGLVVLLWPRLRAIETLGHLQFWAAASLLGGSFSWALGSVLSKKWKPGGDPFAATAWQMTFAGLANLIIAFAAGEQHRTVWTTRGVAAVAYLVVCGSWIGYTAYIWLLQHVPTSKVSTYAYVNPVVAVFLGWLVLNERIDQFIVWGSVITLAAVVMVTSAKITMKAPVVELPAVESAGD
jgi:drug/metabolite transporter (DMT)-like permease